MRAGLGAAALAALVLGMTAAEVDAAPALDPVVEAQNYSKTLERQALYDSPSGRLLLSEVGAANLANALRIQATDPEREFASDLCWNGGDGCAGDARLYDWQSKGYGIVQPGAVHRPRRRHAVGPHLGDEGGAGEAARHRDHERLGAGQRAALLVRRAGARQGGLRGDDLGSAGPGAVGHLRRGRRPQRGLPRAERRPPVLRRHRGRAQLLLLHAVEAVRARRPRAARARATPPSRSGGCRRGSTPPTTRTGSC